MEPAFRIDTPAAVEASQLARVHLSTWHGGGVGQALLDDTLATRPAERMVRGREED